MFGGIKDENVGEEIEPNGNGLGGGKVMTGCATISAKTSR